MSWIKEPKIKILIVYLQLTIVGIAWLATGGSERTINIMAPLYIGNMQDKNQDSQNQAWIQLREELRIAKSAGINAVTTDIWWGLVEGDQPGKYDWSFYDRLVSTIKEEGLRWIPILSFHQLGGNIGDVGYIPLPKYIWSRFKKDPKHFPNEDALKFKSEQGNFSKEYVSFWATPLIREDLERFMRNFRDHFLSYAEYVDEINVSLGPSGELRYPSYNQHDFGVNYPSRGAIQAYSIPAIEGFREAMKNKYQNIKSLTSVWGFNLRSFDEVFPPNPNLLKDSFWQKGEHFSSYGKDFFDYYSETLVQHGLLMLNMAEQIFYLESPNYRGASLGAKIPGIHWRLGSDRLAELSAGLIRTSYQNWYSESYDFGYADILKVFTGNPGGMSRILTFTAIEMSDYRDDFMNANSRAKTLVGWLSRAAHSRGIDIQGENALANELSNKDAWQNITDAIFKNDYRSVTLLRLNEIAHDARRIQLLRGFRGELNARSRRCADLFSSP
jgi:hypothetical protein